VEPSPISHAYNPSYLGGRDQEDCGSKPAQANRSWDPMSKKKKKNTTKRSSGVAQDVGPESKPQYCKKKKKGIVWL
jgi:hypothetical protein